MSEEMTIITNMDKPECCLDCKLLTRHGDCRLLDESANYRTYAKQYNHCPMQEGTLKKALSELLNEGYSIEDIRKALHKMEQKEKSYAGKSKDVR